MKILLIILIAGCGLLGLYAVYLKRKLDTVLNILTSERSRQRSISASYGRITEQWFPLMERYPYDSANFRFLGTPIDGIQFEEDRIVLIEFKSRNAELSTTQRRLKQLVKQGKVYWEEYNFSDE
jgi:predicted Holliday junction resolvase-like endonuclease